MKCLGKVYESRVKIFISKFKRNCSKNCFKQYKLIFFVKNFKIITFTNYKLDSHRLGKFFLLDYANLLIMIS